MTRAARTENISSVEQSMYTSIKFNNVDISSLIIK